MPRSTVPHFHPERVSDAYADERIREKIERFDTPRQRKGLRTLSEDLRDRGVPAATRLHLITAVTHLSRVGEERLAHRLQTFEGEAE